jgi:hypothetical protein
MLGTGQRGTNQLALSVFKPLFLWLADRHRWSANSEDISTGPHGLAAPVSGRDGA